MSLLGIQQPMAAQVAAAAMVTGRGESRREYTAHSGVSDPSSTRYSFNTTHAQMLTHVSIISAFLNLYHQRIYLAKFILIFHSPVIKMDGHVI